MKTPSSVYIDHPSNPLLLGVVSFWGVTTAAGAATGDSVVCVGLLTEPSYDGLMVKLLTGLAAGQVRLIAHHPAPSNTLTTDKPFTDATGVGVVTVAASTLFVILSSAPGGGGTPPSAEAEGLYYSGTVGAIAAGNQFTIAALAGLGAGKFADITNPYSAFVVRDAGGGGLAPQGEIQVITAYNNATGTFTTAAFGGGGVAVGDEILILNPALANAIALALMLLVPIPDAVANVDAVDVIGNKASTPIYAPTNIADIIRYLKGILNTVASLQSPSRSLVETWQDVLGINPNIWTIVSPAIPWAAPTEVGGFLYAETTLIANEVARLRSVQQWVEYPNTPNLNLVVKKTILEWEMMLGVPANLDNAICIWGFTNGPNDNRVSTDLIGFGLLAGVLQAVVDLGGVDVSTPVPGVNLALHNKFRIEIYESTVDWYLNEVLVATVAAGIPVNPMYIQFLFDTTNAGGCAVDIGIVRCWYEMVERY